MFNVFAALSWMVVELNATMNSLVAAKPILSMSSSVRPTFLVARSNVVKNSGFAVSSFAPNKVSHAPLRSARDIRGPIDVHASLLIRPSRYTPSTDTVARPAENSGAYRTSKRSLAPAQAPHDAASKASAICG